jgi:cytochrome c oxidase cbb3-type subunit 2
MSTEHPTSGHEKIETNNFLMIVLILLVVAVGGIVEIVPLFFQRSTTQPVAGLKPYTALELAGRDIYTREGCYNCHSQMIRALQAETLRYGHYSMAGEFVYDHPFQWGSKRTGPTCTASAASTATSGIACTSTTRATWCPSRTCRRTRGCSRQGRRRQHRRPHDRLRRVGVPYSDGEIAQAADAVRGKTEIDALVAYLQVLGTAVK